MYRTLAGLCAAVAVALLLAGLSFSATSSRAADVRILNAIEPESLDPQQVNGSHPGRIVTALFEGLTRPEAKSLTPAPGVAESWDVSEDGLRYTFHLRPEHWSDGVPLGAEDFIYSWRRLLAPETGARFAYLLGVVRGARAINTFDAVAGTISTTVVPALAAELDEARKAPLEAAAWRALAARLSLHDNLSQSEDPAVRTLLDELPSAVSAERLAGFLTGATAEAERLRLAAADARARFGTSLGVYAPDPRTLVVELEAPTPYFLDLTSFYATFAVPRHALERFGRSWFLPENIVTNGPFLLESWRVNDRIRLRKNPEYWGKNEVRSEVIELYPVDNVMTALNLFLTHEADWMPTVYPTDLVHELRQRPDFYTHPSFSSYFYRINTRRPPLDDVRVREAINLAIDRRQIVEGVLGLGQLPAAHVVPPGIPGYRSPASAVKFDVARARQLLAEAGFAEGRGFPAIGILFNTGEAHKKIADVISDQLRENLGIDVRPYNQEWQSWSATVRTGQYDIARGGWVGDYLDPNTFLDLWLTNGANNMTGFSSPSYDALIRAAANVERFAADPERLLARVAHPDALRALLAGRAQAADGAARRAWIEEARFVLLGEAEAILVSEQFPVIPLYFYVNLGLKAPGLRGLYTELVQPDGTRSSNLQPLHPLRDLWREPSHD
jgi:oligopeptide transport system substrate-binding protein